MAVALISVPGTCAQHVVRGPTCMPMPMFARGPPVRASVQLGTNKFMCNLFKCVHKACGCRFKQSSQLVQSQLFSPSRSCPPHSPSIPSQFARSQFFFHSCHFAPKKNLNSSTQPEGLMQYFQVAGAKTGSYRWAFHVGANSNREKHKWVATKKYHAIAITSCLNPLTFSLTLHINSNDGN